MNANTEYLYTIRWWCFFFVQSVQQPILTHLLKVNVPILTFKISLFLLRFLILCLKKSITYLLEIWHEPCLIQCNLKTFKLAQELAPPRGIDTICKHRHQCSCVATHRFSRLPCWINTISINTIMYWVMCGLVKFWTFFNQLENKQQRLFKDN